MKTEYEKMIAGEFYSPMDPELRKLAQEARAKQFAFNQEADGEKRSQKGYKDRQFKQDTQRHCRMKDEGQVVLCR